MYVAYQIEQDPYFFIDKVEGKTNNDNEYYIETRTLPAIALKLFEDDAEGAYLQHKLKQAISDRSQMIAMANLWLDEQIRVEKPLKEIMKLVLDIRCNQVQPCPLATTPSDQNRA